MKKLIPLLLLALMFTSGCFNTNEEITVQKDGSGVYGMTLDFSGLFDMMQAMQQENDSSSAMGKMPGNMDTLIRFASFTDTSTQLTAAEKALMKDATMRMIMQEKEKKFLLQMRFPFKKLEDVQRIMQLSQRNGNMMGKMLGGGAETGEEQPQAPDLNSYYDVTFKQGLLEKKINAEKLKVFQDNPQYEQLKMSSALFAEAMITTEVRLPAKVKKAEGSNLKTSADGKTITISASLSDALENPNALTFRIQY